MDMASTKIEIITKESIKPSSLTPNHLKICQFSLLDQLAPLDYVSLVLFYIAKDDHHAKVAERSQLLKTSLSQALSRFYPLAGRIKNSDSIECSDMGVEFVEAQVHCSLSNILQNATYEVLRRLFPIDFKSTEAGKGCLMLVQANFFQCGGMALGLCFSHKLIDAATISSFIKEWAAMAVESSEQEIPEFVAASRFPPIDLSLVQLPSVGLKIPHKCITRRFLFDASKIAALKKITASAAVRHPTRVEAVTALVWKCALAAARCPKPCVLTQIVNLRKRPIVPPLPQNCFGNLTLFFTVKAEDNREKELQDLVSQLREGIENFNERNAKRLQGDEISGVILELAIEFFNLMGSDDIEHFICTSWCKFPLYEADFGWGKPIWVSLTGHDLIKNCIVLMDTRDGEGIEAFVTLREEDMELLERDQKLLAFASLNLRPTCDGHR